jgi:oligopeptide/dipeptide ABC transporter ATP-binding protein
MGEVALRASDVVKEYPGRRGHLVHALRGVSLILERGKTLGIVGESGCGKSTLARLLVGLEEPTTGAIDLLDARGAALSRARTIQLVFQDPFSSLDPRVTVAAAISEVITVHRLAAGRAESRSRVDELLAMVALSPRFRDRYPHELSGGQAQRVAIARALAVEPSILVLDEPTSALDVSVRAEVMNLLVRLQDELTLSYVFISHDLAMIRHISDEIAVLYLGKVVESGPYASVLGEPLHPYTQALARAVPTPDPIHEAARRGLTSGEATSLRLEPRSGCRYHPRCPLAEPHCLEAEPILGDVHPGHAVACFVAARGASAVTTTSDR